jgi:formate/nitrite transporter FocA (FNT family)
MDLEAAKLTNGRLCRYAMLAALGCLLLTAAILLAVSVHQPSADVAQLVPEIPRTLPAGLL